MRSSADTGELHERIPSSLKLTLRTPSIIAGIQSALSLRSLRLVGTSISIRKASKASIPSEITCSVDLHYFCGEIEVVFFARSLNVFIHAGINAESDASWMTP